MILCSRIEFGREVRATGPLRAALSQLKAEVESHPELSALHSEARRNARLAGLRVVPDPVYREGVINTRPLPPHPTDPEQPLAVYCGPGYTLIVNHAGVPGSTAHTYDFLCGEKAIDGVAYQFTLRAPASPVPGEFPAYKFNHRCPFTGDEGERLPVYRRGPEGFQVAVIFAPYGGLPRPGMHLEYNYGSGFWETLAQLEDAGARPERVMWCVCRHREGKGCPMKRGRLMPPGWNK